MKQKKLTFWKSEGRSLRVSGAWIEASEAFDGNEIGKKSLRVSGAWIEAFVYCSYI